MRLTVPYTYSATRQIRNPKKPQVSSWSVALPDAEAIAVHCQAQLSACLTWMSRLWGSLLQDFDGKYSFCYFLIVQHVQLETLS